MTYDEMKTRPGGFLCDPRQGKSTAISTHVADAEPSDQVISWVNRSRTVIKIDAQLTRPRSLVVPALPLTKQAA